MTHPTPAQRPPTYTNGFAWASRRTTLAAVLAALSLVLHLTVARQFEHVHVFEQLNVLFHADISTRLLALSGGKHLGIKHPNLMPYFTPPIALAAKLLTTTRLATGPEAEVRRRLGTLVVPVASAVKTALVFFVFLQLGYSKVGATVATGLATVSFSTLIFGSIPESYGLTALALAMTYAFAVGSGAELTRRRVALWVVIGVFATGVTVTNVVFVTFLLWAAVWPGSPQRVTTSVRVAGMAIVIFGVTGASAYVLDRILVQHEPPLPDAATSGNVVAEQLTRPLQREADMFHFAPDLVRRLGRFPTTVANAFAPPAVERIPITSKVGGRHKFGFTLQDAPNIFGLGDPLGLSLFLLLVAGTACCLATPSQRPIAVASLGIIGFGGALSAWRAETHLYSQHWHLAAVVLLAGVMNARRYGPLMTVVLGVLTCAIAVNSLMILRAMLAALAIVPP